MAKGKLNVQMRQRIALAIAEYNAYDYGLSAHDYPGRNVAKLSDAELAAARDAHPADARNNAALRFALHVAETRGRVSDADVATLCAADFDEAGVLEIVVNVALNVLTNQVDAKATCHTHPQKQARLKN